MTALPSSLNPVGVSESSPGREPWENDTHASPLINPLAPPASGRGSKGVGEVGVLAAHPQGSRPGLLSTAPSGAHAECSPAPVALPSSYILSADEIKIVEEATR